MSKALFKQSQFYKIDACFKHEQTKFLGTSLNYCLPDHDINMQDKVFVHFSSSETITCHFKISKLFKKFNFKTTYRYF